MAPILARFSASYLWDNTLGILLLGKTLLTKHVIGMLLIGLGLASIDGRPWRALLSIGRARASH